MKILKTSLLALLVTTSMLAQENISFQKPSKEILDLAEYDRAPSIQMDSQKKNILFSYRNTYKTLEDLNLTEMKLGGLRIDPNTNISSTLTYINNLTLRLEGDEQETQVRNLPQNARIAYVSWSPDESKIAFTNTVSTGVELWVIDIRTATATQLTDATLNANLGNPITWFKDSKSILIKTLLANRPSLIDPTQNLPEGPIVSTALAGTESQNRTYQDLLKNKADEINFENLTTSELYTVQLDGSKKSFLKADMYVGEGFSPDGNYLLLTTLQKPFSYIVPLSRFPMTSTVYDKHGKQLQVVNEIPLNEIMPKGFMAVRMGKRNMNWRADEPATLYYAEALDGGDPAQEVPYRDEIFLWKAPFKQNPTSFIKTPQRYAGISWGNKNTALLHDQWFDTRNIKTYLINPSDKTPKRIVIEDRNYQDQYADPGRFEKEKNQYGSYVLAIENNHMHLLGEGFTPEGQFPFIDQFDLKTLKTKRIYQSTYTDRVETIISMVDAKKGIALVALESNSDYPNYYFRDLTQKESLTPITNFQNPFESLKDVYKEVIQYQRADGLELSGTLYLPADYDRVARTEKLPLLIWAYPTEYKDMHSAGQVTTNSNEFTFPYYGSFVYWVAKGYAVLDNAAFPIVGEGDEEPNDTYVTQLVANGKAAIDAVDALGYIDPKRVGVGGHSYGAFMTANLLTHSDLFAVGIARSGAYNRTLTPFGFQYEQRNYWEVPEVYNTMSPFMNADKMKTPMLLVHGEADNNPGTFTLQTERYFQALKGLGAPVRMVILPKESHSYVAKENILHLLWEQDQFLEKYLKPKPTENPAP